MLASLPTKSDLCVAGKVAGFGDDNGHGYWTLGEASTQLYLFGPTAGLTTVGQIS